MKKTRPKFFLFEKRIPKVERLFLRGVKSTARSGERAQSPNGMSRIREILPWRRKKTRKWVNLAGAGRGKKREWREETSFVKKKISTTHDERTLLLKEGEEEIVPSSQKGSPAG